MSTRTSSGFVLVTVLLVSAAIWTLLAGLLVSVRLQHLIAVTARDHRVATAAAVQLVDVARTQEWWAGGTPTTSSGRGEEGNCVWRLAVRDVSESRALLEAEVRVGRAFVAIDATAYRIP